MADFDVVVIGAGPGGYVAALRAAQLGFKVACIEKDKSLGGTCLNVGCIPSKALLDSSEHYAFTKTKLSQHGVLVKDVDLDLAAMMKRKEQVVSQLTTGIAGLFKKAKIERIFGYGKLLSGAAREDLQLERAQEAQATSGDINPTKYVEVTEDSGASRKIATRFVILASGSESTGLVSAPFDKKRILSSTESLTHTEVPKSLLIIGAGAIGLEMGSVWSRLGSKVTVVEFLDRIVPFADKQLSTELLKILTKQGLEFKLSTKVTRAQTEGAQVLVEMEDTNSKKLSTYVDYVLVAIGRRPYTSGLGLDKLGIQQDKAGRVEVNEHFETNVKGVFAIGDLIRGPMLAHKAEDEGIAVAEILAGQKPHINYDAIPNVVYTWPELAQAGFTQEECEKRGIPFKTGVFPFLANGRAKAMGEAEGFVKVIADAKSDRVLGVHILGPRASDMIAEAALVLEFGGSAEDIARSSHAHPTLAEVLKEASLAVDRRQLHM